MNAAGRGGEFSRIAAANSHDSETRIWRNLLIALFVYRSMMSVFAQVVIPEFTSLGDSGARQVVDFTIGERWYLNANQIQINIGTVLSVLLLGNKILVNVGFQALAFVGLYQMLKALPFDLRKRLMLLLFLPSFTLWSSVSGKDAIIVLAMGYLVAYVIRLHFGTARLRPMHFVAVWIVFVFKAHFAAALLYAWGVILIVRHVQYKTTAALTAGLASLIPLYYFRDTIDAISFTVLPHFVGGRSTRENFWVDHYDVFWKAPQGMYRSFMGPTMTEALTSGNVLHMATYVEGILLLIVLAFYAARNIRRIPVYAIVFSVFSMFWILFPNYPFGILNPGSAIRYRADYGVFVFVIFAVFLSFQAYAGQTGGLRGQGRTAGVGASPTESPV